MLKFYDVDEDYVKYLQNADSQIPNISYDTNNKFICGVVLQINGMDYYAPVSSNTKIQKTNLPICDKHGKVIATIRFCFMFPVPASLLTEKDFAEIALKDIGYANLLSTEFKYCKSIQTEILQKANNVYQIGCNKNHRFNYTCCDFKLLEEKYTEFVNVKYGQFLEEAAPWDDINKD